MPEPEEIFRFVNVRPVQLASNRRVERRFAEYDARAKSPFHREVEQTANRNEAEELARKHLAESAPEDDQALAKLHRAVGAALSKETAGEAKQAAEQELGTTLGAYLADDDTKKLKDAAWDRLYAHTLAPEAGPVGRERTYDHVRAFHFLKFLSTQNDNAKPLSRDELAAVTPTIPKSLVRDLPSRDDEDERRRKREALAALDQVYEKVVALETAILDLSNADRILRAQELRSVVEISGARNSGVQPLPSVRLTGPALERPLDTGPGAAGGPATRESAISLWRQRRATAIGAAAQMTIMVPKKAPWVFEEFGRANLQERTKELLETRRDQLLELESVEVTAALEAEKHEIVATYLKGLAPWALESIRTHKQFSYVLSKVPIAGYEITPVLLAAPEPGSSAARGIQPLGVGDLLVVRQELQRYTAGEVAHIENVLKTEFKTRTHTRVREVEEIVITETEELEETEKDLQTTERFELQKESQKTIQEQMSLQAGVSVTGSYGPVSVTAHADFALSQSSTESTRTASTFAKEITEKSVSRIMRRTREERMRRTLERFEEKNEHGLDNRNGAGHVIGIYRWVDKYYKARLINYGRRLMLEFIVPEPAAFYLHLQAKRSLPGVTMEKPRPPMASGHPLEPDDLTRSNYGDYVAQYNVQDVEPYPAEVVRISAAFAESAGGKENMDYAKTSEKLTVPAGYKCRDVFGKLNYQGYDNKYFLECFIAGQRFGSVTAADVEGIIPISVKGYISAFHVNVVAICEVKSETKRTWQLKTYAAIINAYERVLADYNEQVAAAQIQAGIEIQGRNPEFNRKIERDELKKGVLRLLTNNFAETRVSGAWRFNEMFNAMQPSGQFGYPEFNIDEAIVEGRIIQFFEQAFEWNNVTYRFYPYSWGRKSGWKEAFPLSDIDPQFTDFLRAGSARVIVPAHPSYTEAVLHYMTTNEIWNGGSPPTLFDPLYISIVDELKSDAGGDLDADLPACQPDSGYPCLADEWEVKLPTTLVYLQEDAKLPDFTQ